MLDMRPCILTHCRAQQERHARTWTPEEEPALRAAFERTQIAREMIFEEAMKTPAIAIAVRNVARSLRNTAGELFNPEVP